MTTHVFHLPNPPSQDNQAGYRIDAFGTSMPVLKGMALSLLHLESNAFREPHWHPNANELGYCIEGTGIMKIFGPSGAHDTFTIEPGTLSFVPMSSIHSIENTGAGPLRMLICFSHENPEDLNLSSGVAVMSDHVLADTFSLSSNFFDGLSKTVRPVFIGQNNQSIQSNEKNLEWETNRFKLNIESIIPQIQTKGGCVKISNSSLMPTLDGLTMYSLYLEKKGVREPHWHPNANELNYVISGKVFITLLSPTGVVDQFEMGPGMLSFLPKGYFHHIENIGEETARLAVFFSHDMPSDIGLSGTLGAFSNDVLASLFKVPSSYFDTLPKYQEDLFIVAGGG